MVGGNFGEHGLIIWSMAALVCDKYKRLRIILKESVSQKFAFSCFAFNFSLTFYFGEGNQK